MSPSSIFESPTGRKIRGINNHLLNQFHPAVKNVAFASQNLARAYETENRAFHAYAAAITALAQTGDVAADARARRHADHLRRSAQILQKIYSEQTRWIEYFTKLSVITNQNYESEKDRLKNLFSSYTKKEKNLLKTLSKTKHTRFDMEDFYEEELCAVAEQQTQRYRFFAERHDELLRRSRECATATIRTVDNEFFGIIVPNTRKPYDESRSDGELNVNAQVRDSRSMSERRKSLELASTEKLLEEWRKQTATDRKQLAEICEHPDVKKRQKQEQQQKKSQPQQQQSHSGGSPHPDDPVGGFSAPLLSDTQSDAITERTTKGKKTLEDESYDRNEDDDDVVKNAKSTEDDETNPGLKSKSFMEQSETHRQLSGRHVSRTNNNAEFNAHSRSRSAPLRYLRKRSQNYQNHPDNTDIDNSDDDDDDDSDEIEDDGSERDNEDANDDDESMEERERKLLIKKFARSLSQNDALGLNSGAKSEYPYVSICHKRSLSRMQDRGDINEMERPRRHNIYEEKQRLLEASEKLNTSKHPPAPGSQATPILKIIQRQKEMEANTERIPRPDYSCCRSIADEKRNRRATIESDWQYGERVNNNLKSSHSTPTTKRSTPATDAERNELLNTNFCQQILRAQKVRQKRQDAELVEQLERNEFNMKKASDTLSNLNSPSSVLSSANAQPPIFLITDNGKLLECSTPYEARGDNQLTLGVGDRIMLIKSGTRGWVLGRTEDGARQGWYPAKFLQRV